MNKIRIDGKTIRPDETYSGREVLHLLDVSFKNGQNNGKTELSNILNEKDYYFKNRLDSMECKCRELEYRNKALESELSDIKTKYEEALIDKSVLQTQIKYFEGLLDAYKYCIQLLTSDSCGRRTE